MEPRIILFVCNGNIHRSVVAEVRCRQALIELGLGESYIVISRGVQGSIDGSDPTKHRNLQDYPVWTEVKLSLDDLGIDISGVNRTPITLGDVESADTIIVMSTDVLNGSKDIGDECLRVQFLQFFHKMHLFLELENSKEGIDDCGETGRQPKYREVNEQICRVIDHNIQTIIAWCDT
ncbi:MAG: hypothetical protein CO042_00465 [Parcubacteria group bacterium CG_4_9_14_0_2_um_filter_41_8]|nr:MAG: hypothetical protein COY02_03855 [Parcubacteria group bacterium CG_4_10_14_0_2_um_filter_41_6]PJC41061.1 MAG: hypothetical protein CO042_00465 [Parcubacteria group bacterium CG_4_9_14_0_2_um_filter_41_8]